MDQNPEEIEIRPDEKESDQIYELYPKSDQSFVYPKDHPKFYNVPPPGEKPLPGKFQYLLLLIAIITIELCIWAVYRYFSAPIIGPFGTFRFYAFHIVFAPTIHLIPILLFWKYLRKERGLPFVFTRRLILTGVIIGFIGAIIWRVLEEIVYDGLAGMAGGTVTGTFTFFYMLDTPLLFVLMTFVHFCIVGPVEELEFRGFMQDQAARVLPNWQALLLASCFFGFSHIPIAIFVYKFTAFEFVVAEIGWISAGVVIGSLYMWSRNIFAVIIMHGMGNWQLSVFYFSSTQLIGGMDQTTGVIVGTAAALIANSIMIILFYIIHKYYWEPHRRGEPAFGGAFESLQSRLYDHDYERRPIQRTIVILVVFMFVICGSIMGITAAFGERDHNKFFEFALELPEDTGLNLESFVEFTETKTDAAYVSELTALLYTFNSTENKYLKSVTATVTWTDEPDQWLGIRYTNQPDTFKIDIRSGNTTKTGTASNPIGGQGELSVKMDLNIDVIEGLIENEGEEFGIEVELLMQEAGNQEPNVGAIAFVDGGNDYNMQIDLVWLVPQA